MLFRSVCDRGWLYSNLYIEPAALHRLLLGIEYEVVDPGFRLPQLNDPVLGDCLRGFFGAMRQKGSLLENQSRLLRVLARLVAHHFVPCHDSLRRMGAEHRAVERVREWLRANPAEHVSIDFLADIAGLSAYYLVRVFHRRVGVPPHTYQRLVRVELARALLRTGLSIADAAHQAGFYDQSHLNRCFKKVLGLTPGEYCGGARHRLRSEARLTGSLMLRRLR